MNNLIKSDTKEEIPINIDTFNRLTQVDHNTFKLEFSPQFGLLSKNYLYLHEIGFSSFGTPLVIRVFRELKVGDKIHIIANPNNEIYQAWNPCEEFSWGDGIDKFYEVTNIIIDKFKFRNLICRVVL
jgi:hypothetical protein